MLIPLFMIVISSLIIWNAHRKGDSYIDIADYFFAGFIALGVSLPVSMITEAFFSKEYRVANTIALTSLHSTDVTHGDFFLGSGTIEGEQYYFYYTKEGLGFKPGKMKVNDLTTIFEENRQDGLLISYKKEFVNSKAYLFTFGLCDCKYKYEIHIPKGSLKQEFTIH